MICQTRGCTDPAQRTTRVSNRELALCEWHSLAADMWRILNSPDHDGRPHVRRGCALPGCHRERHIGRAICKAHAIQHDGVET